jgi:transposase
MASVVIGVDPHKRSATIAVLDQRERLLGQGRFGTDNTGYQAMLAAAAAWPRRVWAVEGCNGVGKHLSQRLVASGETVVDVPATRVFSTGHGRKTDDTDARSVALVALRTETLNQVIGDDHTVALRLLVDRRDELGRTRTDTVNRLHKLLAELIPGGAKKFLSATQARGLLAGVRPRDIVGKTRRALAADLIGELAILDRRTKTADKHLGELLDATGTILRDLYGIGPSSVARLLGDVGDIARFPDKGRFATWNGTAPIDASSGDHHRHRLSRAGNRRINRVLHVMAIVQLRNDTPGGPTTGANSPRASHPWKPSDASNDASPTPSTNNSSTTPKQPPHQPP